MIPIRIDLTNFLSYRGSESIDFNGLGLACLSGENGAGKSAILDAITWAVWGKSRAQRDADLVSLGETDTEVTLIFQMGVREYRVMRRRTRSRPTLEFDSRSIGAENWLPIGGDSVRDTQARIIDELHLDYDTFANSAFLRQGEADLFTQNKPAERKRILSEILDLSGYDLLVEAARVELRARRQRSETIQTRLGQIDLLVAGRHQIEVDLAETDEAIDIASNRLSELRSSIEALQERLTSARIAESQLARASERIARAAARVKQIRADRTAIEKKIAEYDTILAREAEITKLFEDQSTWRKRADEMSDALAARQPLVSQIQLCERSIDEQRAKLEQRSALLTQSVASLRGEIDELDELREGASTLGTERAGQLSQLAELPAIQATVQRSQDEVLALRAANTSLRARMDEIKERIDALQSGDAMCPICRRPLEEGEHEHIHEEWTLEGRVLGDKYRENVSTIETIEAASAKSLQEIDRLNQLARTNARTEAQLDQIKQRLRKLPGIQEQLAAATQDLERTRSELADDAFMQETRSELATLRCRLNAMPYDEEAHAEARTRSQRYDDAHKDFLLVQSAKTESSGLRSRLGDNDKQFSEARREEAEAGLDIAELEKSLEGIEGVRKRHEQFAGDHADLGGRVATLERTRGSLRRQIEELDAAAREQAEIQKELKTLVAESDAYGELATAFGRNGIQAMVIENVLPELQDEANRILERMTSKQLEVEFHTTRQAVSRDTTIETLDIIIKDESGQRDYQLFSGGEAFRINFAIRVALSKLLARRAGASVDMLVIDEGFGTQDQQGRDGLVEALQSVSRDFALILVVTHVDELRYQFPNRIEITKTDEGSRATLV